MPSKYEIVEAIAWALPQVEQLPESSLYPESAPIDVMDEWWYTPRDMARHIVDHIKPGFLNIEATDAE